MKRKNNLICFMIILGILLYPAEVVADFNSFDINMEIQSLSSEDTNSFYLAEGSFVYIDINTSVIVDIHLRKSETYDINSWSNQFGNIYINYTPPFDYGAMYITFYNIENISGVINGTIYYGTGITTDTTTTTDWTLPPGPTNPPDTGNWFFDGIVLFFTTQNFLNGLVLGGILGFVSAICVFWRYNRDTETSYLVNVEKDNLIDKDWVPE